MVSGELSQPHPIREIMNFHRWYNHPNSNIIQMSCRRKILQPTQIQLSSKACQALPIVDPNPMPISKKRKNFHPISIKEKDQCLSTPTQMLLVQMMEKTAMIHSELVDRFSIDLVLAFQKLHLHLDDMWMEKDNNITTKEVTFTNCNSKNITCKI